MHWLTRLFRKRRAEQQLDAELRDHLERQVSDYVASGLSPEEARRRANLAFGALESIKQQSRESRRANFLDTLAQDVRFGLRVLRKNPGFTAVAVLTLALGVGANAAIFSLINGLLLQTLPVRDPGSLVELLHQFPDEPAFNGFSQETYELMRDQNHVFTGLTGTTHESFDVRVDSLSLQKVASGCVDGTFFSVLGLQPAIGRLIEPEDDQKGRPSTAAVVSWSFWNAKLKQDPNVLGKQVFVNQVPATIVGVAPRGFGGLNQQGYQEAQDIWLPLSAEPLLKRRVLGWGALAVVGRLKPGVSVLQARAEMGVLWHSAIQAPNNNPFLARMSLQLRPAGTGLSSALRQQFTTPLLVLMGVVSLVLLIACTNVANLLLVRGAARQRELGVRICLGAARFRLVRQVLTETLLLAIVGSLAGVAIAYFGASSLVRIIASGSWARGVPANFDFAVRPDLHMLSFLVAVTLLTSLLLGVAPALRAVNTAPTLAMRQLGRSGKPVLRRLFANALVVTQVALSVVLLSGAALFVHYLADLERLDLGFRHDHLLLVSLDGANRGFQKGEFLHRAEGLRTQLEGLPGVRAATLSAMTPMSGAGRACYCVNVEGHPEERRDHRILTSENSIAPNYFQTYGTPLLAGREFSAQDHTGPRVAIINRAMAHDYFGNGSAIGKHFSFDGDDQPYEIVGVVGDARYNEIREDTRRTIYLDIFREERAAIQVTLRTSISPEAIAAEVRQTIGTTMKNVNLERITTMDDQVDATIVPERLITMLSSWFGGLGAALAAMGMHGLLAYSVVRRTNEIGIRMALGAERSDVMRMVLRDALQLVCAGLAIGAPLAFWGKRIAASLIHDLPANNALPIILGALVMLAVATLAAYLPARRACRVDPLVALRYE